MLLDKNISLGVDLFSTDKCTDYLTMKSFSFIWVVRRFRFIK